MNNYDINTIMIVLIGYVIGAIAFLIYKSILKNKGKDLPLSNNGFSIKFHYFFWFIMLSGWIMSHAYQQSIYFDVLNEFPYTLLLLMQFVLLVLSIVAFIGFFNNSKIAWYCTISIFIISIISNTLVGLFIYGINNSLFFSRTISALLVYNPLLIYYYKRKDIFVGEKLLTSNSNVRNQVVTTINIENNNNELSIKDNIQQEYVQQEHAEEDEIELAKMEDDLEEIKSTTEHEDNKDESIKFCRKCGTKLYDNSLFCRKCGTKIIE